MTLPTETDVAPFDASTQRERSIKRPMLILTAALLTGVAGWIDWPESSTSPTARVPSLSNSVDVDPAVAKAIDDARTAVLNAPRSAAAWGRLGMTFDVHGLTNLAEPCFSEAERLDPLDPAWPHFQGILLSKARPADAALKLKRAAELAGKSSDTSRIRLGMLLLSQNQLAEAEEQFQLAMRENPENPRAQFGMARSAVAKKDWEAAHEATARCLLDPYTRKSARILMAQIKERLGESTAAAYRELAEGPEDLMWPDSFVAQAQQLQTGLKSQLIKAGVLLEQGRVSESIAVSRQTLRGYPDTARAWMRLGEALIRQREFSNAEEALRRAIRIDPIEVDAYFHLGHAALLQEDFAGAEDWYRKSIDIKRDHPMAYYALGVCRARQLNHQGAIEAFKQAINCKPDLAIAHLMLGHELSTTGEKVEALEHARLALRLKPDDLDAKALIERLSPREVSE